MQNANSDAAKPLPIARTTEVRFCECEHEGDLDAYVSDLQASGARVLSARCNGNYPSTSGTVEIHVDDFAAFLGKFSETEAFEFSSLCPD